MPVDFKLNFVILFVLRDGIGGVRSVHIPLFFTRSRLFSVSCSRFVAMGIDSSLAHIARSSAYMAECTRFGRHVAMSLTKISKRVGEITPPWGTPCSNVAFLLVYP